MVEREEPERAPKREHASDDPVDSGRQDDRAGGTRAPEDSPAVPAAGEGAELIDNRESDSATPAASGSHIADVADGPGSDAGDHPTVHSAHSATSSESAERTGGSGPVGEHGEAAADAADEQRTIRVARPEDEVTTELGTSAAETGATVLDFRRRPLLTDADTEQAAVAGLIDADEVGSEPLNLSELQADDALLDALGGTNPNVPAESADTAPALESLLVAWRREVDAAPIGDLVDTDAAVAAIAAGSRPRRKSRRRHLVPVASAAAVLMIGFTGVGLAARDAMPGDMLWGVAQVLYSDDHTEEAAAAQRAQSQLDEAERLLNSGYYSDAKVSLQLAHQTMQNAGSRLKDLELRHQLLEYRVQHPQVPDDSTSESSSSLRPTSTSTVEPPPPSNPQLPPPDWPTPTSPTTPSSSQEPTEPTTQPSETSDSTDMPSSGNPDGSTSAPNHGGGLFPTPN